MKIKDFKYKKDAEEEQEYNLLVLEEDEKYMSGINFRYLTEEEQEKVKKIQEDYEAALKPYMKSFRKFLKEKVIKEDANS